MLKFLKNAYKELYAWAFFQTNNGLISFCISYLVLVLMELLNIVCIIIFTQKFLGIALIEFLLQQKIAIAVALLLILAGNYFFFGAIWRRGEQAKEHNNRAFGYIAISLIMGVVGYLCRPQ